MSGVVEKVKAKVEQVMHKDHTTGTTGTHTTGTHNGTHAHHGHSTNAGPHDSNVANKVDPRVDSDRDGSRNSGAATYGPGGHHNNNTTGAGFGTTGTTGAGYGTSTNAGPHDSNIANKLDPRVDSDRDGSRNVGAASYGPGGQHNNNTGAGFGTTGATGAGYGTSTNAGPHDSNIANKLDPRVDSDRDGSRNVEAASYGPGGQHNNNTGAGYGTTGISGYPQSTTAGPHDSNLANKLDPRVDSDRDGSRNMGVATHGPGATHNAATGPARETAGPHSSNLLNKLDPRVDSDADGSRNLGAAQHAGGVHNNNTTGAGYGGNPTY